MALSGSGASQAGLEPTEGSALPREHLTVLQPPIQQMVKYRELVGTEILGKEGKTRLCTNN